MFDSDYHAISGDSFIASTVKASATQSLFKDYKFKFEPRNGNLMEHKIKEILIKNDIDLPLNYIENEKNLPIYLIGPKKHICSLEQEDVLVKDSFGG